jgi:tellurite resistance protein TehA-like permease
MKGLDILGKRKKYNSVEDKKMSAQKNTESGESKFKYILGAILFIGGGLFTTILQVTELYHRLDPVGVSPIKLKPPVWFMVVGGIMLVGLTLVKMWNTFKGK